ncbi:hypothetical protein ED92_18250 [Amycolatopsis sp. MJM2582]|nr:hypothetical protein ED92_18250 [Amycolatopsis sp. MJM2582]
MVAQKYMKAPFLYLGARKGAFTRGRCDCWCTWGVCGVSQSVKASLRDSGSLKEAFTDLFIYI